MVLDKYAQENKELANDILKRDYFLDWKSENPKKTLDILLSEHNCGKCHKCYIKEEYDDSINIDINNFEKIIDWYVDNSFRCDIRLSGNTKWVLTDYFVKIYTLLNTKFKKATYLPKNIFISIPREAFISDDLINKFLDAFNAFEQLGIAVNYEIESNGKIIDEFDDNYYVRLFSFVRDVPNSLLFATITTSNLNKWVEQALWWTNTDDDITERLVINEEFVSTPWNDLMFNFYCDVLAILCNHYLGTSLETKNDKLEALNKIIVVDFEKAQPFQLHLNKFTTGKDLFSCDSHNALTIRCSDYGVFICNNLCPSELTIGKFNIVDDKITDFESNIVELFIIKEYCKVSSIPLCEQCPYVGVCDGICLAHSYKAYNSPMVPVLNECEFQREKLQYIIHLYDNLGLFEAIDLLNIDKSEIVYIKDLIELVRKNYETKQIL